MLIKTKGAQTNDIRIRAGIDKRQIEKRKKLNNKVKAFTHKSVSAFLLNGKIIIFTNKEKYEVYPLRI